MRLAGAIGLAVGIVIGAYVWVQVVAIVAEHFYG